MAKKTPDFFPRELRSQGAAPALAGGCICEFPSRSGHLSFLKYFFFKSLSKFLDAAADLITVCNSPFLLSFFLSPFLPSSSGLLQKGAWWPLLWWRKRAGREVAGK